MKALLIRIVLFFIGPAIRSEIERYRAKDRHRADAVNRQAIELSKFVNGLFESHATTATKPSARSSDS